MSLLWWVIPEVLAGTPMPFVHPQRRMNRGGELDAFADDLPVVAAEGVRAVVSLLNLASDRTVYESAGFDFLCVPIPDDGAPTLEQTRMFTRFVEACRCSRRAVAVHCEAGIGRTGTMLAAYLIADGAPVGAAIARVRSIEPAAIETSAPVKFLHDLEF